MKKTILCSGGAGFIGSHFIDYLLHVTDLNIIVLDRLDKTVNLERLTTIDQWDQLKSRVKFIWWDLKATINETISNQIGNIDFIIHFASSTHVDRSIVNPLLFLQDNIIGTFNLLEFAKQLIDKGNPPKLFIQISTDEVMGSANHNSYTEDSSTHPENMYSATKASAESLVIAYSCTHNLNSVIVRCMNVISTKQHKEKYIPLLIQKILNNEIVMIHADKTKTISGSRHYVPVQLVTKVLTYFLENYLKLDKICKYDRISGFYHVIGEEITNLDLAVKIAELLGRSLRYELVDFHTSRPGHDLSYNLTDTKICKLGLDLNLSVDSVLPQIVNWYLKNMDWLS